MWWPLPCVPKWKSPVAAELSGFLAQLPGRQKVKVVCIDLSGPYRALVKKWFPNARIVADRFHTVRIVMQHFLELARQIAPELKHQSGYLKVLRKRPEKLTRLQQSQLTAFFASWPALQPLYDKMRAICDLFNQKHQAKSSCQKHARALIDFIDELNQSNFEPMKTLAYWAEPIGAMWRFSRNNSITEGFHRKLKLMQRIAYGFRHFNNYRLHVIAQCG
ncbi:transposase [Cerasicoccus maritimus]|uniref:transposase n=1 Tax=Cerasicoccus maritimus TaxID=490089 RepID=UPI002852BB03|nr:transposase [Cerasicoccus maritimus]